MYGKRIEIDHLDVGMLSDHGTEFWGQWAVRGTHTRTARVATSTWYV
jgi:hypothetical protein